jgi:hypothetical protein
MCGIYPDIACISQGKLLNVLDKMTSLRQGIYRVRWSLLHSVLVSYLASCKDGVFWPRVENIYWNTSVQPLRSNVISHCCIQINVDGAANT